MKNYYKIFIILFFFPVIVFPFGNLTVKTDTVPAGWTFNRTDKSHNFAIPYNVTVRIGVDTTLDQGDYIGAFYDTSGYSVCGGWVQWIGGGQTVQLSAWGDDPQTKTKKDGFAPNEAIQWKLYKINTGVTYNVQVTMYSGSVNYTPDGLSQISTITLKNQPPWFPTNTVANHTIAIPKEAKPTIFGKKINVGDFVGVFYDSSGTLACAGFTDWKNDTATQSITVWGDNVDTPVKDGMANSEVFKWKIWRYSDSKQFLAKAYYKPGQPSDSLFIDNGMSVLDSLSCTTSSGNTDTTVVIPDTIVTINCNYSFGDGDITKTINYRMIGLPCDGTLEGAPISIDNSVFYGRTPNIDWVAFWDSGTGDYIAYTSATKDKFVFAPGNAFWVLSKYSFKINQLKALPVKAASDGTYKIPLIKGWNMISNPFTSNVDWSALSKLNGDLNDPIWDFDESGKFVRPTGFLPYRGYYFYNRMEIDSLVIPKSTATDGKITKENAAKNYVLKDPIKIILAKNSSESASAYISIDSNANNNLDNFDQFTPPSNFEDEKVYLYNDELTSLYKCLYIEARPEIGNGQAFDIRVKHNNPGNLTLKFEGLEKYYTNELYLINKRTLKFYSLKESAVVTLSPNSKSEEFILAIGSKEYFQGVKSEIKPIEYSLNQNYPNPFNPSTTISWQLSLDSRVTVKIYDLLGRELYILVSEIQGAGNHQTQLSLDKYNLASGVYFYYIKANALDGSKEFITMKKMLILK